MTTFSILAAVLALTAALFVAVPLWRGPASAAPALARRGRILAAAAFLALPLGGVLLYTVVGHPEAVSPVAAEAGHGVGQQQLDALVARLAARLQKDPQDARGWVMLARAQSVLGRFQEATQAYARAAMLLPDDAQLLADYADALAMAQGGRLAGEPEQLIARALRADAANAKALALAGTAAFEKKDYAQAVAYWERLRSTVPPDSEFGASVQQNIDEARGLAMRQGSVDKAGLTRSATTRR